MLAAKHGLFPCPQSFSVKDNQDLQECQHMPAFPVPTGFVSERKDPLATWLCAVVLGARLGRFLGRFVESYLSVGTTFLIFPQMLCPQRKPIQRSLCFLSVTSLFFLSWCECRFSPALYLFIALIPSTLGPRKGIHCLKNKLVYDFIHSFIHTLFIQHRYARSIPIRRC